MGPSRERTRLPAALDGRITAAVAATAGALAVFGASLTWIRVEIDGVSAPGSFTSGLDGRDGRTVVAVGVAGLVVAALLVLGRSDPWLPSALLVAGGVATIIAAVSIVEASDKAARIEREFGVPAELVAARPGAGLWVVLLAGVAMLAAGVLARYRGP